MKKLLIFALTLCALSSVAQIKPEDVIKKKLLKSDMDITDEKKSVKATTWIDRASIYLDAEGIYTDKLIAGFASEHILPQIGTPISETEIEVGGAKLKKVSFEAVDVYVSEDGLIQYWQAKKSYIKDALGEAVKNLKKAKELDEKVFKTKGTPIVLSIDNLYQTNGMSAYRLGQHSVAANLFDGSYEAKTLIGQIDTVSLFYAGVAYSDAKEYQNALDRFTEVLSFSYYQEGAIYYYMGLCLDNLNKKEEALKLYETGFEKYPENQAILSGLINSYMISGKNTDQLITIIHKAQELDPKNVSLYLVEGNVWDKLGNTEKAEEVMLKAIEIAPDNFDVFYNYAILKVLQAEKMVEKANTLDLNDTKNYNEMVKQAVEMQKAAIANLEKAYQIKPQSADVVDMLRQLYFPRRDDSPEMQVRYDFFNDLYKKAEEAK